MARRLTVEYLERKRQELFDEVAELRREKRKLRYPWHNSEIADLKAKIKALHERANKYTIMIEDME